MKPALANAICRAAPEGRRNQAGPRDTQGGSAPVASTSPEKPPALPHAAHQGHTNQEIVTEVPVKPPALAGSVLKSGLLTELGSGKSCAISCQLLSHLGIRRQAVTACNSLLTGLRSFRFYQHPSAGPPNAPDRNANTKKRKRFPFYPHPPLLQPSPRHSGTDNWEEMDAG